MKGLLAVLVLIALVAFSDIVSAHLIKPLFHRLRPCQNHLLDATLTRRISCGSGYSFISSHASNHFAIGIFISLLFKEALRFLWIAALLWAGIISFAQVYMGLHYPLDVLTGALVGTLLAFLFYKLAIKLRVLPL